MKKCIMCENAKFDRGCGQYKCKRLTHTISDPDQHLECRYWAENPNAKLHLTKRWIIK